MADDQQDAAEGASRVRSEEIRRSGKLVEELRLIVFTGYFLRTFKYLYLNEGHKAVKQRDQHTKEPSK